MRLPIVLSVLLLAACGGESGNDGPSPGSGPVSDDEPVEGPASGSGDMSDDGDADAGPVGGAGEGDAGASGSDVGDPGVGGDADTGEGGEDDSGGSGDGASGEFSPSVINLGNYLSLTEFAVQMNIVILTDRAFSPTLFLARFPGNVESLAGPVAQEELLEVGPGGACALGGSFETMIEGDISGTSATLTTSYADCTTESGVLNGSFSFFSAFGGNVIEDEYDLAYTQQDGADGAGTTVVRARFERGRVDNATFDVDDYSRNTERNPFAVSGSGGRMLAPATEGDTALEDDDIAFAYDTEVSIETGDESDPVELTVTMSDLVVGDRGPVRGTLSIVARDGSRVDVGASDTPGAVSLAVTDRLGATFGDTVAWNDIYRPR